MQGRADSERHRPGMSSRMDGCTHTPQFQEDLQVAVVLGDLGMFPENLEEEGNLQRPKQMSGAAVGLDD